MAADSKAQPKEVTMATSSAALTTLMAVVSSSGRLEQRLFSLAAPRAIERLQHDRRSWRPALLLGPCDFCHAVFAVARARGTAVRLSWRQLAALAHAASGWALEVSHHSIHTLYARFDCFVPANIEIRFIQYYNLLIKL